MTTNELREKFEAWATANGEVFDHLDFSRDRYGDYISLEMSAAFTAYAFRDAEVEALRKDAERYRWLVKNAEIIECHHWHWWNHDSDVTPIAERIDAAMLEDRT